MDEIEYEPAPWIGMLFMALIAMARLLLEQFGAVALIVFALLLHGGFQRIAAR